MSSRGGRDRFRRDHPSRHEDNKGDGVTRQGGGGGGSSNSNSGNPPSRHLWVGNLSHSIVEDDLAHHFLRYGPAENIAFQPGRSYAFINFQVDEDAIASMRELQGFPLAGNPLRIEFAKAVPEKRSTVTRNEVYSRDERRPALGGSPFSQREFFRGHHGSPELHYSDKSQLSDKNPEPSEVLWIGFPAQMKVDESILGRAFSPYGEIEKISTFPGRSYAFVRYKSVTSACRALDSLKGKLFGNPRVHICFAKSEGGSSSSGKSSFDAPHSPSYKSTGRDGPSENFRFSRDQDIYSPNRFSNRDSNAYDFNIRGSLLAGGTNRYEQRIVGENGTNLGVSQEFYEHMYSPSRERHIQLGDFSQKFPRKAEFFEDLHGLPEDNPYLRVPKKLKTGSSPPGRDLPEYPFSELEKQKHAFPRLPSEFLHREPFDKSFNAGNFTYGQTFDHQPSSPPPRLDRHEGWKPYDSFQMGPAANAMQSNLVENAANTMQPNLVENKRLTPELDSSSLTDWKWEGTIAKGGTPVCRARCFPVGKVLDMPLPEFLDCTARTSLDMLSKHYYQAVGVWVVFFVPGGDADLELYNEFMHYLEEKQRAAVSKLDDKTTLFLVPPSDFSEKVLKVPGKLSIAGVILRLDYSSLNHGSINNEREKKNENSFSYNENISYPKSSFPPELGSSGINNHSFLGNKFAAAPSVSDPASGVPGISESHYERSHDYPSFPPRPSGPNWSSQNLQNLISNRTLPPHLMSGAVEPIAEQRQPVVPRAVPDANSAQYSSGVSGIPSYGNANSNSYNPEMRHYDPLSMPVGSLPPEQLAQLAATLLEQQRQSGSSLNASAMSDPRQNNRFNMSENSSRPPSYSAENNQVSSEPSMSQFGQVQQLQKQQQMSNVPQMSQMVQREPQRGVNGNQQLADSSSQSQEDAEGDPQKRLQATLQLAAVLLRQIQQGKGT